MTWPEAVMVREHVQAIRAHCSTVLCGENDYGDVLDDIVRHALELEADLAALRAYALACENDLAVFWIQRYSRMTQEEESRMIARRRAKHPRAAALLDQEEDG